ncbi:MAG: hypothetical protein WAV74_12745 [Anaerolineae bacterium]|nr:hypothetical protein [Anaerolineae bacterium]
MSSWSTKRVAPLILLAWLPWQPSARNVSLTLAYFLLCLLSFACFNHCYLLTSTPWRHAWPVIVPQTLPANSAA